MGAAAHRHGGAQRLGVHRDHGAGLPLRDRDRARRAGGGGAVAQPCGAPSAPPRAAGARRADRGVVHPLAGHHGQRTLLHAVPDPHRTAVRRPGGAPARDAPHARLRGGADGGGAGFRARAELALEALRLLGVDRLERAAVLRPGHLAGARRRRCHLRDDLRPFLRPGRTALSRDRALGEPLAVRHRGGRHGRAPVPARDGHAARGPQAAPVPARPCPGDGCAHAAAHAARRRRLQRRARTAPPEAARTAGLHAAALAQPGPDHDRGQRYRRGAERGDAGPNRLLGVLARVRRAAGPAAGANPKERSR